MEIYENENDQVEAVKRFFAENGKALAVGVILGVGALIGWRYWNSHQVDSARSASLAYQNAVTAVSEGKPDSIPAAEKFAAENKNTYGASVLTSSPKNKYTEKTQKESEKFSKILLEEYVKSTGAKNRGVIYRDDLTGTNWAEVTNTLIELGFMSNEEEDKKLSDEKYQEKIIDGLVNGIEKYLKSN